MSFTKAIDNILHGEIVKNVPVESKTPDKWLKVSMGT